MAGSSNALDVSTPTHDLKFMMASNVNVSNFVSVKLSGGSNYKIWKAQMLCLIESQLLLHIIDAEYPFPVDKGIHMIGQYDKLVKGWILGSFNEKVLKDLVDLGTAQEVWMKLECLFNIRVSDTEGDSSKALDVSAPDDIAPVVYAMREDLKYLQALNVDVSNFVSEKLEGFYNYYTWKNEMLYLVESHELLHIIHAEARFPRDKADPMTQKYDSLVRGWILNTMNDNQRDKYRMYRSVQLMWRKLESTFTYKPETSDSDTEDKEDDSSSETEDFNYMQLKSNVNVSDIVSVKLSGHSNYNIWRDQMVCLLTNHSLLHIIQVRFPWDEDDPMAQKYGNLVRDWILSTMNQEEHRKYTKYQSVQLMWRNIESTFDQTEELKYMEASNVNVSNFVSVKLSGRSNYNIWKDQMGFLLKCHNLLHIIHFEGFRWDEDAVTQKYCNLVRDWILSTMNDEEHNKYRIYRSVKLMWRNIEWTFEDLKYMEVSNVNVSNFVSVKLSNDSNYSIWRAQMLYLLESHSLLNIIADIYSYEKRMYHELVNSWILCTMKDELLKEFPAEDLVDNSVNYLMRKLESRFREGHSRPEPVVSAATQDLTYTQALNVNVSNFVSVKLSGRSNYRIWKAEMLCLLNSQKLLHVIDNKHGYQIDKYEHLVKGWIFSTMNEKLLSDFTHTHDLVSTYNSAKDVWKNLTLALDRQVKRKDSTNPQEVEFGIEFIKDDTEIESDLPESDNTDKKRWYKDVAEGWRKAKSIFKINKNAATEATTANDNTVLQVAVERESSGTQVVRDIPDIETEGSMTEVVRDTPDIETESSRIESLKKELYVAAAKGWRKAKSILKINKKAATEAITLDRESVKKELYKAAAEGRWRKAKSMLINNKIAATEAITTNGNTILHVAVEMGHNYFVEQLLEFLKNGEDVEKINEKGRTALHIAAAVGNTQAAQLLVGKRRNLLEIVDHNNWTPLHLASENTNLNTYEYLFESTTPSKLEIHYHRNSYWNHRSAILAAIFSKQYDLAEKLLKIFPFDAFGLRNKDILMAVTITFPTDLGFTKTFIYPSFHNVCQKIALRWFLLFHTDIFVDDILRVVNIGNNMCCNWLGKNSMILLVLTATLYPLYHLICLLILMLRLSFSTLYLLLWKVLAVFVRPINNIEQKRKEYKKAKNVLRMVCKKMCKSRFVDPTSFSDSLFEATRLDIYEVVDEILFTSPATLNCKDEEQYNIIQSSILNRAEKVYNLIYHIIERTKSHREMIDSSLNNLGHLAGRLAPSFVLSRTTGAALQLQREILWFEEVEKLVLPLQLTKKNIYLETPAMVFTREHKDLLKQGEMWMKTTAESCSITAALIVTVVFAAAITVPGGNDQESGIPLFKKEIAFTIFAVSNAFSLFTASTALLLFLSILTTRFSEKDFLVSLPRRLIFGLFNLFISTIAMMIAFCAILFLVLCDQRPWMLAPICAFACLPISVIVTIKLPLLVDLIQSTHSPIFGKQSYFKSCKVNRRNSIFTK